MSNPLVFTSKILKKESKIFHGVFGRKGGVSHKNFASLNVRFGIGDSAENVIENRKIIAEKCSFPFDKIISLNQTHSANICVIKDGWEKTREKLTEFEEIDDKDAIICNQKGFLFFLQVADCQPLLLFDPRKKVIAAIHAGWMGLKKNIINHAISALNKEFEVSAKDLLVFDGPSLGLCHSEFLNREIELPEFREFFVGEKKVDLQKIAKNQLLKSGVLEQKIEFSQNCTYCDKENFFSYRRDNVTGRFTAVIGLL